MKSNKGYIAASISVQMIMIPVLLTVMLIVMSGIIGQLMNMFTQSWLGNNAARLIYIMIAFLGILIISGVFGFVFSKLYKNKPNSASTRYIPLILPIIYALVFAVTASILSKGNYNSSWWAVYVYKNPFFLIFDFGLVLSGLPFIMPVAELSAYSGFVSGVLLHEWVSKTALKSTSSLKMKAAFALLCTACIIFICIDSKDIITSGMIEFQYGKSTVGNDLTEFDLMQISPFKENNGLARLEKKASLEFVEFDQMPRLDGATAAYPVYAAFVQEVYKGLGDYYEANKNNNQKDIYSAFVSSSDYPLNIVKCSKTADAYERLINKDTDIIFVAEPSKAQVEEVKARGDEFVLTPIGSEAFVFFTNIKNPVDNLTIKQIQDIYSGNIRNWKEVSGQNKSILPYQRPQNSGSQTIMENKVMKGIKMLEPTKETYASGMGEIISQVAGYKNALNSIGYSFMYYSSTMIKNNQIKYISVDGVKPSPETVRSKKYPFTVPVYAVTLKSNTNKNVSIFLGWILSDEGQSLVEKTGYVSVK